jgi:hypothetical protein
MINRKPLFKLLLTMALSLCAAAAQAWDGVVEGQISDIHSVVSTGNYEFRVSLKNQSAQWCGSTTAGSAGWAAMHATDPNFKPTQAVLMLAAATGRTVTLYLVRDAGGYCKIGYVHVRGLS